MFAWLRRLLAPDPNKPNIPHPPFLASKRTGAIMNGLWYGELTPEEARAKALGWGWDDDERLAAMIAEATQPPSYWGQYAEGKLPPPTATARRKREPRK